MATAPRRVWPREFLVPLLATAKRIAFHVHVFFDREAPSPRDGCVPRWNDRDPTDLEELTHRTIIIIFGSIALAIIVIVLVMLALWIF
jgi:hypothetical protein